MYQAPTECGNGHPLGPGLMTVSFRMCTCAGVEPDSRGHYAYRCNACGDVVVPKCVDPSKQLKAG